MKVKFWRFCSEWFNRPLIKRPMFRFVTLEPSRWKLCPIGTSAFRAYCLNDEWHQLLLSTSAAWHLEMNGKFWVVGRLVIEWLGKVTRMSISWPRAYILTPFILLAVFWSSWIRKHANMLFKHVNCFSHIPRMLYLFAHFATLCSTSSHQWFLLHATIMSKWSIFLLKTAPMFTRISMCVVSDFRASSEDHISFIVQCLDWTHPPSTRVFCHAAQSNDISIVEWMKEECFFYEWKVVAGCSWTLSVVRVFFRKSLFLLLNLRLILSACVFSSRQLSWLVRTVHVFLFACYSLADRSVPHRSLLIHS